jgi:hypothetical protein
MGGAAREACPTTSMVFALAEQASFHQAEAFYFLFGGFTFSLFLSSSTSFLQSMLNTLRFV